MEPQFICLTCKTVIGPIWDDYDNQCKCRGPYDFEVYRVAAIDLDNNIVPPNQPVEPTVDDPDEKQLKILKRGLCYEWFF